MASLACPGLRASREHQSQDPCHHPQDLLQERRRARRHSWERLRVGPVRSQTSRLDPAKRNQKRHQKRHQTSHQDGWGKPDGWVLRPRSPVHRRTAFLYDRRERQVDWIPRSPDELLRGQTQVLLGDLERQHRVDSRTPRVGGRPNQLARTGAAKP